MQHRLLAYGEIEAKLAIAAILLYGCLLFLLLSAFPFLKGTDAYYYALQSDYWFRTGRVKVPDSSFIFPAMGSLQSLGISAESAFYIWVSFAITLVSSLVAAAILSSKKHYAFHWMLVWLLLSPSLLFCAIEFPKQFSLWFVLAAAPFVLQRLTGFSLYLGLGFLAVFALNTHRSAALYIVFFFVGIGASKGDHFKTLLLLIPLPLCAFLVQHLFDVDPVGIKDILRLGDFNLEPALFSLLRKDGLPLAIKLELLLSLIVGVLILRVTYLSKYLPAASKGAVWALLIPVTLPCMSNEVFSAGERVVIFFPLSCFVAVGLIGMQNPDPSERSTLTIARITGASIATCMLFFIAPARVGYSHPPSISPNYSDYMKLVHVLEPRKIPMLIAHQGFNFFYKFQTTAESFSYEPETHWQKQRIWRLVYGVSADDIAYFSRPGCGWESDLVARLNVEGFMLFREDCYGQLRAAVPQYDRPDLYWLLHNSSMNPSRSRPSFLYEKHRADAGDEEFPALPSSDKQN